MCKLADPYHITIRPEWKPTIVKARAVALTTKPNRDYDIPYLAGYNTAGTEFYIDRHVPKSFMYKGKKIDTDPFLMIHEVTEKYMAMKFGMKYPNPSHYIATDEEARAVCKAGVPWAVYSGWLAPYIKECASEKIVKAPHDLDLEPYRDENDKKDLVKLYKAMGWAST